MRTVINIPTTQDNDINLIVRLNKINIKTKVDPEQNTLKLSFGPEMDGMALRAVNFQVAFCLIDPEGNRGRMHTVDRVLKYCDTERKWYMLKYHSKYICNNLLKLELSIGRCNYMLNIEHILRSVYLATKADSWDRMQEYIVELEGQLENNKFKLEQLESMDEQTLDQVQDKILEIKRERNLCCICKVNSWTHTCVPCGHSICEACSDRYDRENGCPICRTTISDIIKVYK